MPPHPLRDALDLAGTLAGSPAASPVVAAALARFHDARQELTRQVRRGDLTVKVARERAAEAAGAARAEMIRAAGSDDPSARPFLARLIRADERRRKVREDASAESLQRETNRLLRQNLLEQQLRSREAEFEARAFSRPFAGGQPAPTLDGLLDFHDAADLAGDEAAREWARRQLETFRPRVVEEADRRRIDLACDRPDRVNPRLVTAYVEALREAGPEAMETFAAETLESRDANACVAAFLLARGHGQPAEPRWARAVLSGLDAFPDSALGALRTLEAEVCEQEARAARALAEAAASGIEAEARLADLEAPTDDELARLARFEAMPVVSHDEPIGLAAARRWPTEPAATGASPDEEFA